MGDEVQRGVGLTQYIYSGAVFANKQRSHVLDRSRYNMTEHRRDSTTAHQLIDMLDFNMS